MRSFSTLKDLVIPMLDDMMTKLTHRLCLAARNPSKPHFNHYLFETLSLAIRIACKKSPDAVNSFEALFFPPFQDILQQDVQGILIFITG
jgi:exportin-2 (importin alpha re-exporter)